MSNVATLPTQVVDTRYTQDVIPILDTAKFEHMQRIATAMAECSTIPDSFRFVDGKSDKGELPRSVVVANCFRVVNQAVRWGFDPFAVMDCASIVHGKLMWEGKLVSAVIDAKLGVRLSYTFDEKPGRALKITVSGTLPGEVTARTIEGTVADWHKGDKSPWSKEGDWKRQLRYRGNREWARAHAPAVMLGIYADDELSDIAALDVPTGQRALRMKDITPPKPAPAAIPFDIPEPPAPTAPAEAESSQEPSQEEILAELEKSLQRATSVAEIRALKEAFGDLLAKLDETNHDTAIDMIEASLQAAE